MLQRRQAHGRRSSIFNSRERELQAKAKADREEKLAAAARLRLNKAQQQASVAPAPITPTVAPASTTPTVAPSPVPNSVLRLGTAKQRNKRAPAWVIWLAAAVAGGLVVLQVLMS